MDRPPRLSNHNKERFTFYKSKMEEKKRKTAPLQTQFLLGPDPESFDPPKFIDKINIVENYNDHLV